MRSLLLAAGVLCAVAKLPGHPPACSCDAFCRGECSFQPPATAAARGQGRAPPGRPPQQMLNLTAYRFTPRGVVGLAGKNSGDDIGDLSFFLSRRALTARCTVDPDNLR